MLDTLYMRRLVASPEGRAFLFNFMADAEVSDEGMVFEELLARVEDPSLKKMVEKHHDDELRHNQMLLECLRRAGGAPSPVPDDLRITVRLGDMLGTFFDDFFSGKTGVLEAYSLLQVIEERAVKQYPLIAAALREVDPESARVVDEVARDEARHVKYAHAIGRKYAPDAATHEGLLLHYRKVEERAFFEYNRALMGHVQQRGLLRASAPERLFWRAMRYVAMHA
ncbi:MAG: ferritin-like domain-containing protein [Polyangiales bacterium]